MLGLKQLIPPSTCLHCQICCRFPEKNTVWQPRLSQAETSAFKGKSSLLSHINKGAITLKKLPGIFCCSFFKDKKNSCRIYKIRPFDCRLYPFVLVGSGGRVILAAHQLCPFVAQNIQTKKFQNHASYLKKFFAKKDIQGFLKTNPTLIQDYQGYSKELIPLFPLTR